MMALRSMQQDKKTCTRCHWPEHSPTLYQLQLNKQRPPFFDTDKRGMKEGGAERKGYHILAEKAFHCNREKLVVCTLFTLKQSLELIKYTHTKRVDIL